MSRLPARIVVTGATGNVGTAVLRLLAAHDDAPEITAIARRIPPARDAYARASWRSLDLADPEAGALLRQILTGADAVVHLAWGFQPSYRRAYLRRVALDGTRAVITAAIDSGVAHVVHMSSGAVYSPGSYGRPVDETWSRQGVGSCVYSVDKVHAEHLIDDLEATRDAPPITRFRPGFIGQRAAGSGLERYVLPELVPAGIVGHLPFLPLDGSLAVPAVHADDVARAIVAALERRASGPFNLASPVPVGADDFAAPFGCRTVPVPVGVLREVADLTWRARLQPVHGGWIDLAYNTPMLDCSRAREELDWEPGPTGPEVWDETIRGMRAGDGTVSPVLRPRGTRERASALVEGGPIGSRRLS